MNENETQQQANKRKYDEIAETHGHLLHLYQTLAQADEETARAILARIRNGEAVSELIKRTRPNQDAIGSVAVSSVDSVPQRLLLLLAQSVAPLQTIVHVADLVQRHGREVTFPGARLGHRQVDSIIRLEFLAGVLDNVRPPTPATVHVGPFQLLLAPPMAEGSYSGPLYFVS